MLQTLYGMQLLTLGDNDPMSYNTFFMWKIIYIMTFRVAWWDTWHDS